MKVAVSGKGGVGKTLIAGTLARMFAKDGFNVLAIDNDSAMNLSYTLGIDSEKKSKIVPISEKVFEDNNKSLQKVKSDRSRIEYYFTCTPSLPLYILKNYPEVDIITYLDADLFFFSNPAPIYNELGNK